MNKIIDFVIGDLKEKKRYRSIEKRAKALPKEFSIAYKQIRNYIFNTSGIETINPLSTLVDILEEAAENNRHVLDITGPDVAAFADELVRGEKSYFDRSRQKLNSKIVDEIKKSDK